MPKFHNKYRPVVNAFRNKEGYQVEGKDGGLVQMKAEDFQAIFTPAPPTTRKRGKAPAA